MFSLAIINAKLWFPPSSNVPNNPTAIGVIGDTISLVSDTESVLSKCDSNTKIIDAKNKGLVCPGFTDCHCHFLDGGLRLLQPSLRDVKSKEEFRSILQEAAAKLPEGVWITGGDWDHHKWGGFLPDKSWIDDVTPKNPVWMNRMDGHMSLANQCALNIAGIDKSTPEIAGGEIIRDELGNPTGMLKDNAQNLVSKFVPKHTDEYSRKALELAMAHVAERGVTEVHTMVTVDCACGLWPANLGKDAEFQDMEAAFTELSVYKKAHKDGVLKTRIRAALPIAAWKRLKEEIIDKEQNGSIGDDWLRVGCVKAMIDGSLGSHTSAMFNDYDDTPGYKGHLIWDPKLLEKLVYDSSLAGMQVMVHAIGDYAVNEQLNIFERVGKSLSEKMNGKSDFRFRIEHAQHMIPSDIQRFGQLGVIASMQMSHLADDGRWATAAIGEERMRTSWPMGSLLSTNATVVLGSDWFVTPPSPLEGIYSAVTRRTLDGLHPEGLNPEECVTVDQAIEAYTVHAAFAAFEDKRGLIQVGKLADLVLLDNDIRQISVDEILTTQILFTIVGGKVVYSKEN